MKLIFSDEVKEARAKGTPLVALESSLIAHGFPSPDNFAIANNLQAVVRDEGAIPATIAVLSGHICVGISEEQMSKLAEGRARKCSARDLPLLCAMGLDGATTVAATLRIASAAAIPIFATGGIGGVHRGARESFDISADLVELGKRRVAVVCAGAKSLLDLHATVEMLETLGVPVVGFRCTEIPSFFSAESGIPLEHSVSQISELAAIVRLILQTENGGGLVICNPPPEDFSLPSGALNKLVDRALKEAGAQGISGADLTPSVLSILDRLSSGRTRACNKALLENNVRLASRVALALNELDKNS